MSKLVERKIGRPRLSQEKVDQVKEYLLADKYRQPSIADEVGISLASVQRIKYSMKKSGEL